MTEAPKTIFQRLENIPPRAIWAFMIIIIIIPLLFPVAIPVIITEQGTSAYNTIAALKPGDVVLYRHDTDEGSYISIGYTEEAVLTHIWRLPGVSVVFVTIGQTYGITTYRTMIERMLKVFPNKVYGVDYVYLGYVPGATMAYSAVGKDMWAAAGGVDFYGNKLENLQLMANVHSMRDIDLIITTFGVELDVEYWQQVYGTPIIGCTYIPAAEYYPYFIKAYLAGTVGASEYEKLIGIVGPATRIGAAFTTSMLGFILLIIFANILQHGKKLGLVK